MLKAVVISLRLNTSQLITEVLEAVPKDQVEYILTSLPLHHVKALLVHLVNEVGVKVVRSYQNFLNSSCFFDLYLFLRN